MIVTLRAVSVDGSRWLLLMISLIGLGLQALPVALVQGLLRIILMRIPQVCGHSKTYCFVNLALSRLLEKIRAN